ncbi:MAG: segregation/condensation protein A [Thermoguttaceae bacterium]|nr:segregation/condensation protein A [Thermoguttaceae bacterium]MDW8036686.1 segregation/condensation protein A [Thermoguttaceae bacterium]
MAKSMDFRVALSVFEGPLDLLLFLVRRHELDITEVSLAQITEQFLEYLSVLEQIDMDAVGEFVAVAALLIEMKSQQILPHPEEVQEEAEDARRELVQRLLEYKKYRDAANLLQERARQWQERFSRLSRDVEPLELDPSELPVHEVELWDLVSAFGRILRESEATELSSIIYDDTPIQVYMARIMERLLSRGHLAFNDLFEVGMHKSTLIGIFLAVLELVRHKQVLLEQNQLFGEIWLLPATEASVTVALPQVTVDDPSL